MACSSVRPGSRHVPSTSRSLCGWKLDSRRRSVRELLCQASLIIAASILGYSPIGAERIATEHGTTWQHYAAIEHRPRSPPRLTGRGTRHSSSRQSASFPSRVHSDWTSSWLLES